MTERNAPGRGAPIGVFDSGLGGLTAVRELRRILPGEDIVYFGDTGRVPYGTRGVDVIVRYAKQDIAFLLEQNVKYVMAACGTVSSTLSEAYTRTLPVPYTGVVQSAAAAAVRATRTGLIGVIGTPATIKSGSYNVRANAVDYPEFLLELTEVELQTRMEGRLKRRLRDAKFPMIKTLENFDAETVPGLDRRLLRELAGGDYIKDHRNVILLGKTGTGKTHMATALGVEACRQGISTRFVTGCGLANELIEARESKALSRLMQRYARLGLLIVDELGYVPLSREGAELLFHVMAERHERGSVIITTNLGFADWTQVFGDATLTAALLDRLTHKAFIISCNWESYRLRETLRLQGKAAVTG